VESKDSIRLEFRRPIAWILMTLVAKVAKTLGECHCEVVRSLRLAPNNSQLNRTRRDISGDRRASREIVPSREAPTKVSGYGFGEISHSGRVFRSVSRPVGVVLVLVRLSKVSFD
jgi:hypothetical protein